MAIPRHIFKDGGYYHDFQGIGDSCSLCNQTQEEIENQKRKPMTGYELAVEYLTKRGGGATLNAIVEEGYEGDGVDYKALVDCWIAGEPANDSERDLARETAQAYAAERDRFIELAAENGVRAEKAEARVGELEQLVVCQDCDICGAELPPKKWRACAKCYEARVEELQEALRKIAALALGDYSGRAIARAALSAKEKVNESK